MFGSPTLAAQGRAPTPQSGRRGYSQPHCEGYCTHVACTCTIGLFILEANVMHSMVYHDDDSEKDELAEGAAEEMLDEEDTDEDEDKAEEDAPIDDEKAWE